MSFRIFPTQRAAGLFAAAVDKRLGYPRTHTADEVSGYRGGSLPRTETHCAILALADGTFAVEIDDVVVGLSVSDVAVDVGVGREDVTIDVAGAVATVDRETATLVSPRGGLTLRGTS